MISTTKKVAAGFMTMISTIVMTAAYAAAQTAGPLDGVTTQVNNSKDEFSSFVIGTGIPVLFGLLILGVGIRLGVKYLRRAARSA